MTGTPVEGAVAEALRAVLSRGVERSIITQEQAARLAALQAAPDTSADDERLRFVTGFADVFVTVGILLFLGSVRSLATSALGGGWSYALIAVLAWGLAELFTRRRRMALPSIVLLVIFAGSVFLSVGIALAGETATLPSLTSEPGAQLAAAVATIGAVALHYRRFAVPITVAAGTAALVLAVVALASSIAPALTEHHLNALVACAGAAVFALAMRFDLSDPTRLTRRADIAFWLHLLAAPLIVHPVLSKLVTSTAQPPVVPDLGEAMAATGASSGAQILVLAVVLLLSIVALVTDRRAILVSGLAYAGYTIGDLIRQTGFTTAAMPLSLLMLGAFILLLSAGWRPLRRLALLPVPKWIAAHLPNPVA